MFAKIINEETKQCEVGVGTNAEFYKSIGMSEMEVEQAYNGVWYVAGYAPEEPEAEKKAKRKAKLIAELDALDLKCIRALRAIQAGTGTDDDTARLAELEEQAEEIRKELQLLNPVTEAE
jgi:hypothetical protein